MTGCESLTSAQNINNNGFSNVSCEQINSVFKACGNDKTSLDSILALAGLTITSFGDLTANEIFTQTRDTANVALLVKGCGTSV
ncbi:MAG: hypothetical protein ACI90U_000062 [Pseudomonadales bacterium]|jgi:hypothetical protein